ncbi:MAG: hypothetical protein RL680_1004 [Actinomycetota bacterium]|jgi:hypothetical protein
MALSGAQIGGIAGFIGAYGEAQAQAAVGIQQQTGYLLQARNTLAVAEVNSQFSQQYATIQAGRTLKKAEIDALNYKVAGNSLLKNMRATNASIRARAASSGVVVGEGSFQNVQNENVRNTMFDVGITDLSALTARVMGFEDATAMMQSTEAQNTINLFSAQQQAGQYTQAGSASRSTGGLMATQTLVKAGIQAGKILI